MPGHASHGRTTTRILFVCTDNVHRSVLAERLLAARLPPGSALRPESAGTEAWHRSPMEDTTRAILEELGGDGSGFGSRPLTAQLMAGAPLILGLAREHREAAVRLAGGDAAMLHPQGVRAARGRGRRGGRWGRSGRRGRI
ncbi:low molecular weight phosphatase family protein [Streptomyces massasporeus]|uniref:arsenate-mycothiol transferase ArsC n=1 Tax=Streptomyces massasporeus TaxID=67324 RepID=UPI003701DCC2